MFLALIPFITLIISVIYSRNIILSISLANIASAIYLSYINDHLKIYSIFSTIFKTYKTVLNEDSILLILFIILLSTIIEILVQGRIIDSYLCIIKNKIKNSDKLKKMTLFLHPLLFLDDYLAVFSLKGFMGKLLKIYNIANVKFAYLFASNATSYCLLIPLSSWGLMLLGQYTYLQKASLNDPLYNPISLIILTIPFLLYPLNSIINSWYIIYTKKSYGLMKKFEDEAMNESCIDLKFINSDYPWYFFITPFILFIIFLIIQLTCFFTSQNFVDFNTIPLIKYMTTSMFGAYIITLLIGFLKNKIRDLFIFHIDAIKGILAPIFLLISAWSFALFIKKIGIIPELILIFNISQYESFYPILFFLFSTLSTITIGSTWGNIAVFIPVIAELHITNPLLLYTTLAAVLSGMIAGSHFTPTSDACLINSIASDCNIIDHYKTNSFYSLSPFTGSLIGFLLLSFLYNQFRYTMLILIVLPVSLFITFLTTFLLNKKYQ